MSPISLSFYCVCWGLSLRNLSTPVLGRLFKQAHVHAGIDFKKYDDIEVFFFENGPGLKMFFFPLLCWLVNTRGYTSFFPFIISMFFWDAFFFLDV